MCWGIYHAFKGIKEISFVFDDVQVRVLQEQLSVEAHARNDAQVRVERLLQQNTDLLRHISLLVRQIQELEIKANGRFTSGECLSPPFPSLLPISSGVISSSHIPPLIRAASL